MTKSDHTKLVSKEQVPPIHSEVELRRLDKCVELHRAGLSVEKIMAMFDNAFQKKGGAV